MKQRKLKGRATSPSVVKAVGESAYQIWLAGLGALAKAQSEGGRLFQALIAEGEKVEARGRKRIDAQVKAAEHEVEQVRAQASSKWDKLEKVFEDRVARTLPRLGVPNRADIRALAKEVRALNAEVSRLHREQTQPPADAAA